MEIRRKTDAPEPPPEDQAVVGSEEAQGMSVVQPSDMPSRFLPYPKDAAVFYRPYNYDELYTFSESEVSQKERVRFVNDGIITRGMDVGDLTVSDWLYLGLLRKISVFQTGKFTVTVPADPSIGRRTHTATLDISSIGVEDLNVPSLPAAVTVGGKELLFSPLTLSRFEAVMEAMEVEAQEKYEEAMIALSEQGDAEPQDIEDVERPEPRDPTGRELMAYQCINMDPEEALPLIKKAVGLSVVGLDHLDKLFRHRVSPVTLKWKQKPAAEGEPEKEYTKTVEIDDPTALVWPFRGSEEHVGDAVRFGVPRGG